VSACCWIWGCRRRKWTIRIAASASGPMARSTCGWTRAVVNLPAEWLGAGNGAETDGGD